MLAWVGTCDAIFADIGVLVGVAALRGGEGGVEIIGD